MASASQTLSRESLKCFYEEPLWVRQRLESWGGTLIFLALEPVLAWPLRGLIDPARALILSWDDGPAADSLRADGFEVRALGNGQGPRSTDTLILLPEAQAALAEVCESGPAAVLAFKPSARLTSALKEVCPQAPLLAGPVGVARGFENKLRFPELVADYGVPVPRHRIIAPVDGPSLNELFSEFGPIFVAQQAAGYSGDGTSIIRSAEDWRKASADRPERKLKISEFLKGRSVTINGCVLPFQRVIVGAPMEQLTGWPELTPFSLGSCGNIWNPSWLEDKQSEQLRSAARGVGAALAAGGYYGHFGIDAVVPESDSAGREIVVIETNPRLTANFVVDATIARMSGQASTLALHVLSCLGLDCDPAEDVISSHTVTQWIFRQLKGQGESPLAPWGFLESSGEISEATPPADFGLRGAAPLLWRSAPGRALDEGAEAGRLLIRGEIRESLKSSWLEWTRRALNLY